MKYLKCLEKSVMMKKNASFMKFKKLIISATKVTCKGIEPGRYGYTQWKKNN